MEISDNLVNLIESLTWPVIALIAFILLRSEFRGLVSRIRSVKSSHAEIVLSDKNQEGQKFSSTDNIENELGQSQVITNKDFFNREVKALEKLFNEKYKGKSYEDKFKLLIQDYAEVNFSLWCEKQFDNIFRSQIELLELLNSQVLIGMTYSELELYFQNIKNANPEPLKDWSAAQYLSFLLTSQMIIIDEKDKNYKISDVAQEFLLWVVKSGKLKDAKLL